MLKNPNTIQLSKWLQLRQPTFGARCGLPEQSERPLQFVVDFDVARGVDRGRRHALKNPLATQNTTATGPAPVVHWPLHHTSPFYHSLCTDRKIASGEETSASIWPAPVVHWLLHHSSFFIQTQQVVQKPLDHRGGPGGGLIVG